MGWRVGMAGETGVAATEVQAVLFFHGSSGGLPSMLVGRYAGKGFLYGMGGGSVGGERTASS